MVEVGTVVDRGLLGRTAAEHLWSPGVQVRVEVKDCDWTVGTSDAAQKRQSDGVVAAQSD